MALQTSKQKCDSPQATTLRQLITGASLGENLHRARQVRIAPESLKDIHINVEVWQRFCKIDLGVDAAKHYPRQCCSKKC